MSEWQPGLLTIGSRETIRVSASDVESLAGDCGMYGAFKVRRKLKASAWQWRYSDAPFALGIVRDVAISLHADSRVATYAGLRVAIAERLDGFPLHPGIRRWAEHAIESYLDAHEALSDQFGPTRFRMSDPVIGKDNRYVTAWAPMYEGDGVREVRRMRFGSARPGGTTPGEWAVTAAFVAAFTKPFDGISRVRVVEVGLLDGSTTVIFDDTSIAARDAYDSKIRSDITRIIGGTELIASRSCGSCKIVGCCSAPGKLDGHLGQAGPGVGTRSVSASDLETYASCPAQWLMRSSNLPREDGAHPAAARGRNVHTWLRIAHARGVACRRTDLPDPGSGADVVGGLEDMEYEAAHPFLIAHLGECPIGSEIQIVSLDEPIYGYDRPADVIVATRPDLLFIDRDGVPILRETKTTEGALPLNEPDAFDRWFQIPWLIGLFASGAAAGLQVVEPGVVELEVLTPSGGKTYSWRLDDEAVVRMARAEVASHASPWHRDSSWHATPGPQCGWCPVQRWCPSAGGTSSSAVPAAAGQDEPEMPVDEDPPF